ncbi:MAG TPA: hypothetical protein VKB79_23715 [Bryobacteraceae bacterium]|nr:hypothetical protein [Bryobacteraceae bacterium]
MRTEPVSPPGLYKFLGELFVGGGPGGAELRFQPVAGARVHAARGGFGHDRIDSDRTQGFGDFFHLPRAAFAVNDHSAHHIAGQFVPVDAGEGFGQRGKYALGGAVFHRAEDALGKNRFHSFHHDAAAHFRCGGSADPFVADFDPHAQGRQAFRKFARGRASLGYSDS